VVIGALVGAAYHHDNKIAGFDPNGFVSHRRLQQVTVFIDPLLEIDGCKICHNQIEILG
jgi:hypothetical protein